MRNAAIFLLIFAVLSVLSASEPNHSVNFVGEVSQGETFRKRIGHGLDFVLRPSSMGGGITGWTIEVSPQGQPADPTCTDFVWVVTPPYHFQNPRYLDTSYRTLAQEAVRISPREFRFVLNCADFKTERERVELVLYRSAASKQAVDEAMAKLGSSPLGTGRLWIEDYRIDPGKKSGANVDLGAIHWIKFKVEIEFPADHRLKPKP